MRVHFFHAYGPVSNFEPLLGIPTPRLTHEKLQAMHRAGVLDLAHIGGVAPPSAVPFNVNEEIYRRFVHGPERPAGELVAEVARGWVGKRRALTLVRAWRLAEKGVRGFMPNPLYFSWGVWYRILVRPLVPDIERIPERERRLARRPAAAPDLGAGPPERSRAPELTRSSFRCRSSGMAETGSVSNGT